MSIYNHKFSPLIQQFIDEYVRLAEKEPNSRIISIAFNEILPFGKRDPLEVAAELADDPVVVGYWEDKTLGMAGLMRSGDDFIARVDPTDRLQDYHDIDQYVPDIAHVLAKSDRLYIGNLIVDDDVKGAQTYWRIVGINPMAVMNHLIRRARLLGLGEQAA